MLLPLLRRWRSWFFPHECDGCGSALPDEIPSGLCSSCDRLVRWFSSPQCARCAWPLEATGTCARCASGQLHFDAAMALAAYEGPMKRLLHAYKYGGRRYLAAYFESAVRRRLKGALDGGRWDAVAAVPLGRSRLRRRGYNQSRLVASRVGRGLTLPDWSGLLERKPGGEAQARLDRRARRSNVSGRFSVRGRVPDGSRILLIDDVLTTGQTASECARALKEAGASHVTVLTLARGL